MLDSQPWHVLEDPLRRCGADPQRSISLLKRYAQRLLTWNRSVSNLISRNDEERFVTRHLLESLEPAEWLKQNDVTNCLDFGSGSGLPALPLAIAGIGSRWELIESRRPKILFLRSVMQDLGLVSMEAVHSRIETLPEQGSRFDGATSRATQRLGPTLVLLSRFVSLGGHAYLWKGGKWEGEMKTDDRWRKFWEFDAVMGLSEGSSVVARFRRIQA